MSLFHDSAIIGASGSGGGAGYSIERSLRFNSSDSAYLSRTPASAGNRKTWTWAGWVKLSGATRNWLFSASETVNNAIEVYNDGRLYVYHGSGSPGYVGWSGVLRDYSAWYHLVVTVDTTQATSTNRVKAYINGNQITFNEGAQPAQNSEPTNGINSTSLHNICRHFSGSSYTVNCYLADIHFCDGAAYDASAFGEFDANGIWQPKKFAGVYGTNGFKLSFSDNSTAAALGTDSSGAGNTWSVNNLSVTAGAGNDSLVDVPTNGSEVDTGSGGQVRGNYCTWNPLSRLGDVTQTLNVSNGNLTFTTSSNGGTTGSVGMSSGKWYWELACSTLTASQLYFGITAATSSTSRVSGVIGIRDTGVLQNAGGATTNGSGTTAYTTGDIVQFAFDADNRRLFVGKNNTWLNSSDPAAGTGASFTDIPAGTLYAFISDNNTTATIDANFGQRPFAYTAPSGFKALSTANLPAPGVTKPSDLFDVKLYTGNGGTQSVTGLGFNPDFVWLKSRSSGSYSHNIYDAVRGATKIIYSDSTSAENTDASGLTAFNSDGFSLGSTAATNASSTTYVGWCWDAGSSTVTNTQGSITSQVRANASAGFSIVTYTGTGSNATVGHGLGVAPKLIICKTRTSAVNWIVYHGSLATHDFLRLNTTDAKDNNSTVWNTAPTSTVFGIGSANGVNQSSDNYVAYCFSEVAGYSSFGSYTGNGSADGPFVFCGFRPRWILIKQTDTGRDWRIYDTSRNAYNLVDLELYPNAPNAEATANGMDLLSNGFKFRSSGVGVNTSGGTYIYAAFAEHPFAYARAR
jgi:hypothetical protein